MMCSPIDVIVVGRMEHKTCPDRENHSVLVRMTGFQQKLDDRNTESLKSTQSTETPESISVKRRVTPTCSNEFTHLFKIRVEIIGNVRGGGMCTCLLA